MLAFTGDMSYWPNEDAVLWFAQEVLPRLRADQPGLRFAVVGRGAGATPAPSRGAPWASTLTGAVPDVRPFLAHAALVVAPLRIARGVPNKVLEAMAMGKAVVATPAAVEGLRLGPGQDILIAEPRPPSPRRSPACSTRDARRHLGARARARAIADYSWEPSFRSLDRLIAAEPSRAEA